MKHGVKRQVNSSGRLSRLMSPRAMTMGSPGKARVERSKSNALASRLKLAKFSMSPQKKSLSGMAAALSAVASQGGGDWNFATLLTANALPPAPLSTHLRYRPMGFASFVGGQESVEHGKSDSAEGKFSEESERIMAQRESPQQSLNDRQRDGSNNEVLSEMVSDEHSFLQCCNNRDYVSFQSKMAKGANRVMSIETDDAARVAEDLLHQIDVSEAREAGDSNKVAARLGRGVAARPGEKKKVDCDKGSAEHYAQRIDKAMELLAARNQRHKRLVRVQIVTTDPQKLTAAGMMNKRSGWDDISGHEVRENPIAKAMLHGWCCGYNLDQHDSLVHRK